MLDGDLIILNRYRIIILNMLSKIALNAAAIALSALTISAAPAQLTKQSVQIYTKCVNSSQVALTFDGEYFVRHPNTLNNLAQTGPSTITSKISLAISHIQSPMPRFSSMVTVSIANRPYLHI